MRLFLAALPGSLLVLALSGCGPNPNYSGSWTFTWDNDSANTNAAVLNQDGDAITGNYVNDSKENCPITGQLDSSGAKMALTITCPKWEIKSDGSIVNPTLVEGKYLAYGDSSGDFKMAKN
ncbi:MAG TPA: hypothetical protein VFX02_13200 [Gammaproteobacteria bacterium]|nr:hypothetical protein [Gammaproteobacteria bacterium]